MACHVLLAYLVGLLPTWKAIFTPSPLLPRPSHHCSRWYTRCGLQLKLYTVSTKVFLLETVVSGANSDVSQQFVVNIFRSCEAEELYQLKDMFDVGEVEMDLSMLVYDWISDPINRTVLLKWFEMQAKEVIELRRLAGEKRPLRILSDIDDTLVHSGFGEVEAGPLWFARVPVACVPTCVPLYGVAFWLSCWCDDVDLRLLRSGWAAPLH